MIGGLLTLINNLVATLLVGVGQALIVPFTTPFAFAIGRLLFPKLPVATLIYTPLVLVSVFTLNLGPPGPWKIAFLVAPILTDAVAYLVGIHRYSVQEPPPLSKILIAFTPYPFGLLVGAWFALKFFGITLPLMQNLKTAIGGASFLWILGAASTWAAYTIFKRTLRDELVD